MILSLTNKVFSVRQTILCTGNTNPFDFSGLIYELTHYTGDTTLEGSNAMGTFSGTGSVHQCRNWDAVKEFLVEKRANDFERSILHT
jgi:hypothetical protein